MTTLVAAETNRISTARTSPNSTSTTDVVVLQFNHLVQFDCSYAWHEWNRLFENSTDASHRQYPQFIRHQMSEFPPTEHRPIGVVQNRGHYETDALGILMPYRIRFNEGIAGLAGPGTPIHGYRLASGGLLSQKHASVKATFEATLNFTKSTNSRFVLIEDVVQGSDTDALISESPHTDWHCFIPRVEQRWGIHVNVTRDEYWRSLSKNARKKIRRCCKGLQDAEIISVTEVGQVADFVRDIIPVADASWKTRQNGPMFDENELTQRLTHLASNGMLRAWQLVWNNRPIAFDITVGLNGRMEGFECAYDEEFADLSPGTVLLSRTIDDLIAEKDVDFYDFGHGDMSYKQRFSTDCRQSYHAILMPPGVRSTALLAAIRASRFAFHSARNAANRLGVKRLVKELRNAIC